MRFEALSPESPLFGPHLLEASAGTGKTFAIEHVFVRLILAGVPIEEILVVTFTRAIARELKVRIRTNLEKALTSLQEGTPLFPYLEPHLNSEKGIMFLTFGLKGFDRAQIFTIHGFCFRMLNEFAIETGRFRVREDPDHLLKVSKRMRATLHRFFSMSSGSLSKEQLSLLFSKFDTVREIEDALLKGKEGEEKPLSFEELEAQFIEKLAPWDLGCLEEEFEAISPNYRAKKGDFIKQVQLIQERNLRKLLLHRGTIFSFLSIENKKLRPKNERTSPFFEWAEKGLAPLVFEGSNQKRIFQGLLWDWKQFVERRDSPDEILKEMREGIEISFFKEKVKKKYQVLIIDEFQDTDPLQWEIFYHTFIEQTSLAALYLVGDPKQSIYRFRNADVYTYFHAKKLLGKENTYTLDVNYRSSKELIDSLNTLFSKDFLKLPRLNVVIPYRPVEAGSSLSSDFGDGKKAIHFLITKSPLYAYAAQEIERLKLPYGSVAILVKDRFEAQEALDTLKKRGIPCVARSHQPLGKTKDFHFLRDFLDAVLSPWDGNLRAIVEGSPFDTGKSFQSWKETLEEKGLSQFFSELFASTILSPDLKGILEEVFAWERREGFSISGLKAFLREFEQLSAEEGAVRKMDVSDDAVQVMTLHISKGLEFDLVFALALGSPTADGEVEPEEYSAEKLRQLYVAMTRAKKRLYVPYIEKKGEKKSSPMDLFLDGEGLSLIKRLSTEGTVSYEEVEEISLQNVSIEESVVQKERPFFSYTPSYIQSFTSLKRGKEPLLIDSSDDILPRGKETGTFIHGIFESIFSTSELWKEDEALDLFIANKLRESPLENITPYVQAMIQATLSKPLFDGKELFSLKELRHTEVFPEMEFFYTKEQNYISGSIDLVFFRKEILYFIDWKTNILRSPTPEGVQEVMNGYQYALQASLYKEALEKHFEKPIAPFFGGAFYLFVRTGSYTHFIPETHA